MKAEVSTNPELRTAVLKSRPAEPVLAAAFFASAGPTPFWSGYVSDGTRDGTILAPDLFVIEAVRQQPTRSLRYVVLENGSVLH